MKNIAILGSTGSIGTQALDIIRKHPSLFRVELLTANNRWEQLVEQAVEFNPNAIVIGNSNYYSRVKDALQNTDIKIYAGEKALAESVESSTIDMVLVALVGFSGLNPTISAIKAHKTIALANKETLVVAGELITRLARENRVPILPVDSEHSAIFQCLMGEQSPIEKVILTASGGPFMSLSAAELEKVTPSDALKHPNWNMGSKITIDSATLMNKGLEVIEAKWLFGLTPDQIEVVIHPQSIIHSMVQFLDGSIKAQMGMPDMRVPIQLAFTFPDRLPSDFPRVNFTELSALTFAQPDLSRFRNLLLARQALTRGGNQPCILNAANEVAVDSFLKGQIGFMQIATIIESVIEKTDYIGNPSLEELVETDNRARSIANLLITQIQ